MARAQGAQPQRADTDSYQLIGIMHAFLSGGLQDESMKWQHIINSHCFTKIPAQPSWPKCDFEFVHPTKVCNSATPGAGIKDRELDASSGCT